MREVTRQTSNVILQSILILFLPLAVFSIFAGLLNAMAKAASTLELSLENCKTKYSARTNRKKSGLRGSQWGRRQWEWGFKSHLPYFLTRPITLYAR